MSADRCSCCDLPAYSCGRSADARAVADEAAERVRLLTLPGVVAAVYPGSCSGCWCRFPAGAPIRRDGEAWRSLECCPTLAEAVA